MNAPSSAEVPGFYHNHCFLAGNSRVSIEDKFPVVEPQLLAFRAAVNDANRRKEQFGTDIFVSVAFDHKGVFRKQFLKNGLPNSRKRHPKLTDLLPQFSGPFIESASQLGFDAASISALHEDSAKTHISYLTSNDLVPDSIKARMVASESSDEHGDSCEIGKTTCASITAEYYRSAVRPVSHVAGASLLEVYIELDPWSVPAIYGRGIALAHRLGISAAIRLNIVSKSGAIASGAIAPPHMNFSYNL